MIHFSHPAISDLCRRARFASGVCLIVVATLVNCTDAADKAWTHLEADGVTVLSDAADKDTAEFMLGILAYRQAFYQMVIPPDRNAAPVRIMLFRKAAAFHECAGPSSGNTVLITGDIDGEVHIGLALEGDRNEALTRVREFNSMFELRRPGYFFPLWMEHGTGTLFATLRQTENACVVGEPDNRFRSTLQHTKWMPWSEIAQTNSNSPRYNDPEGLRLFIAQS